MDVLRLALKESSKSGEIAATDGIRKSGPVMLQAMYLMDPLVHFDCTVRHDGILWDWRLAANGDDSSHYWHGKKPTLPIGRRLAPLRPKRVAGVAKKSRNSGVG
jgi:hypothetical protein